MGVTGAWRLPARRAAAPVGEARPFGPEQLTLVVTGQRRVADRNVGTSWTYALLLFAAAVVLAVAFLPGVHDLMGFAAPGWSTAFVPPLCVLLTIAWLRWPAAAMAIRRRWRPGAGAHGRIHTTDP